MATQRMLAKPIWSNKFIKEGPRSPFSISEPDNMDSVCVRIDMPGADRKSLKIKIKDDRISFRASEDPASMHGGFDFTLERARTYVGSVIFDPSCYNAEDYNYVLVHGALWLYIRRYNSSVRSLNHVLLEKGNDTSPASGAAYNPLVSIGRDRYYTHVFTEDAFIMGVDMPGLRGEAAIMMAVQGLHLIIFRGEERVSLEDNYENEERRVYDGALKVDKHLYDAREFKSEFLNGVLWIEVPRRMKRDAGSEEPESTVMLYGLGRFGVDFGINTVRRG